MRVKPEVPSKFQFGFKQKICAEDAELVTEIQNATWKLCVYR